MITQAELKEILEYNPETGKFIWIKPKPRSGVKVGAVAGYAQKSNGYRYIRVNGKGYRAHRLAFLFMTGEIPKVVDHINRQRDDNRWANLRESTPLRNQRNRTLNKNNNSGLSGVIIRNRGGVFYEAWIKVKEVKKYLGRSDDKFEAFCMRKSAENMYWATSV